MNSLTRRFISIYFLIVDSPLAFVGLWGLQILFISTLFNALNNEDDGPDYPPPSTLNIMARQIWLLGESANILIGFALMIGYVQSARKVQHWTPTTLNRFWWASCLYNALEVIHNIVIAGLIRDDLRFWGAIAIPIIGAVLSFLAVERVPAAVAKVE